ncbi:hypothetical protein DENSPDRAFT_826307 [Dentipellis sp. KUC8613]|nr:hypothetical protein DENSPDRAFT_826307 [Dentipellis sp. KUC8613]
MSNSFNHLLATLSDNPVLIEVLDLRTFVLFFRLTHYLHNHIQWMSSPFHTGPPAHLPPKVASFLSSALSISISVVTTLWSSLREFAWSVSLAEADSSMPSQDIVEMLVHHGVQREIGVHNLYPPSRFCMASNCKYQQRGYHTGEQRALSEPLSNHVTYFSQVHGPVPAISHSLGCSNCGARYYPTYYIHRHNTLRTHYEGIPHSIHVATHAYVETSLCRRFTSSTVNAWVSFSNNARIYNQEHAHTRQKFPAGWANPDLTPTVVADAFFILALLQEQKERGLYLELSNVGDQSDRLDHALRLRTISLVGPGRENWSHICDKCCAKRDEGGQFCIIRAVVMDGITIGRPCCKVHNCQEELPSQRAHFCKNHAGLNNECVVVGCHAAAPPGYKTCPDPSHRTLEDTNGRSALFILRRRLERLRMSASAGDEEGIEDGLQEVGADGIPRDVDENDQCTEKPDGGNTQPKARFGRRRTHNEQLVVATCGVILGRATMFGSEGLDGTRVFLHALFPTKSSVPQVIFYDTACRLKKHILHLKDHHFDRCIMPVDAFHAKTKHKESDEFCGTHCNAAMFPELVVNGHWRFNSSAAEMTNAWFGGFQAMTREMRAARYDFFLDEMIKLRNRTIVGDLHSSGAQPVVLPLEILLNSDV